MALLSSFQTLPMLIVERIVKCLEGRTRNWCNTEYDISIDDYNDGKVVHQLIWVSEHWRVAALSVIRDNCEIQFNTSSKGFNMKYPALSDDLSYPQCHMERLVKRVVVSALSWNDLGSGKFRSTFSQSTFEFPTFSSASTLAVCFESDDEMDSQKTSRSNLPTPSVASTDRNKETIDFAHCLRQMTPAATGLNVVFCSYSSTIEKNWGQCNNLVQQLCSGNISRLRVESRTDYDLSSLDLHSLSGLTSIAQGFATACAPFAHVAYRSADTLRELSLVYLEEDDWRTLIYGGSNTPAVYSRLTKLLLGFEDDEESTNWAAIDGAVSFPALSEMTLEGDYPFSYDLLFPGNGSTLRKLYIPFRMLIKNVLGRFNVFNRSGTTRMSLIDVGPLDPFEVNRSVGQSRTPVVQQFRSILEATTTFSLKGAVAAKYLLQALEPTASAAVLRELRLYERPLCASKALSIISAIPSLVTLTSKINESVSDTKAIPPDEHPNALHVKYPRANISFRRLNALSDDSDDEDENRWSDDYDYDLDNMIYCLDCGLMRDKCGCDYYFDIVRSSNGGKNVKDKPDLAKKVAAVAVQIAVLCPNFGHVVLPREVRGEFSWEVTLAMANGPFVSYANRLSRLIYQD